MKDNKFLFLLTFFMDFCPITSPLPRQHAALIGLHRLYKRFGVQSITLWMRSAVHAETGAGGPNMSRGLGGSIVVSFSQGMRVTLFNEQCHFPSKEKTIPKGVVVIPPQ